MYYARKLRDRQVAYAKTRAKKELRRRRAHKTLVMRRRRRAALLPFSDNKPEEPIYIPLFAPREFSILNNRDAVIKYFEDTKRLIGRGTYTRMDMSDIEYIDLPTLCLLSSFMRDKRTRAHYLLVAVPPNTSPARKIFHDAQFEQMILAKKRADFTSGSFLSRSDKDVNKKYIGDVLQKSVDYFGTDAKRKLNNLAPILVEIINNTSNHAKPNEKNVLPWLINTLEREEGDKRYKQYCLVDLGVGIYSSISRKTEQWHQDKKAPLRWMRDLRGISQNSFFSRSIPLGIQSTTDLPERGRGIRYIYNEARNPIYKRFEVITNRAHIDLLDIDRVNKDSDYDLEGTIYYWEICVE